MQTDRVALTVAAQKYHLSTAVISTIGVLARE